MPHLGLPLLNHRAIITGASRGIGLSIATLFASQGASVTLVARTAPPLEAVLERLPRPHPVETDGGRAQVHGFVDGSVAETELWRRVGERKHPTILINAAGLTHRSLLLQTDDTTIADVIGTNLVGTMMGCRAVARGMIKGKSGGCIINISSVYALKGGRGSTVYAASKAGVIGFSRSLATELSAFNIRVNAISPGYIDTDMLSPMSQQALTTIATTTPSNRLGTVEEIANTALFIATNQFVNGANMVVDGGLSAV
ncbi:hypothetical protein DFH27DRAFT_480093 [Peziza echinospora]|nr:hypothetical protein DFH27DRAFT_480093 [Peziza echinospora]